MMYATFSFLGTINVRPRLALFQGHSAILYVCMVGFGIIMEVFQYFMHLGRSFDLADIAANTAGVGAIWLLLKYNENTIRYPDEQT